MAEVCAQISNIFAKLGEAHRAYGEVADGLAEMVTSLTPGQYTILLAATTMPTIQIVVPGQLVTPFHAPLPPPQEATTAVGKAEIIKFTKKHILPNPESPALDPIDKNVVTRVLAAVVFLQLESKYFDVTMSCATAASAFQCNISQISKAITGIDYKSGPHHFTPKKQRDQMSTSKRKSSNAEPSSIPTKKPTKEHTGASARVE